jgi:outer membrane protein TolC
MLSLEQVRQLAMQHNIELRTADNHIRMAQEQQREAFTAYFPQLSSSGIAFKSNGDMLKAKVNTSDVLPSSLAQSLPQDLLSQVPSQMKMGFLDRGLLFGVTAMQPLFMGGRIVNGNKLAKVGVEAAQLQRRQSENDVRLNAERYFWQVVRLKENLKTLHAIDSLLSRMEDDVNAAVEAGVALPNDLLQVQLRRNEVESNKVNAENGLALSKMMLAQYIGMDGQPIDVSASVSRDRVPEFPLSLKADHDLAVKTTPEYGMLQKNVEAKTLQRRLEIGKRLPSVAVGASLQHTDLFHAKNDFAAVFATVRIPISDWWGGSHAIKRSKLAEQNAREELEDQSQLLRIRMQKNWNDVSDAYRQLTIAHKSISQSEENLRLHTDYYNAGTASISDLLEAEQLYQQSCDHYIESYSLLQTKITEYRNSIGQ